MKTVDKYQNVFGSIDSLSDNVPWTMGLTNLVENLIWDTKYVLGIPKKQVWDLIIEQTESEKFKSMDLSQKKKHIKLLLEKLQRDAEVLNKYEKSKSGYCSGREALRRIKYFSEDYLNKEFDVFMSLSSDNYLDFFYKNFITLNGKGRWVTHGNGSMYSYSVDIDEMQMDNLAYNTNEELLIANELKLGGTKNKDQLLKYCYMFHQLKKKKFISEGSTFLLLFIGDKEELFDLNEEIDKEISYCETLPNKEFLITKELANKARNMSVKSITWHDVIDINNEYFKKLDENQQVEMKLLQGFNISLKEKAFLYSSYQN